MKFLGLEQKSDWVGILSSIGCIIHCLAMPFVVYFSGAALEQNHHDWLDYLFVGVTALAMFFSVRQAHSLSVKILLIAAWLLFAVSSVLQPVFSFASPLMYLGSLALIVGHTINLRHCRQCKMHRPRVIA